MAQNRFRGKYRYSLDEKGRVNIPSKFRKAMSPLAQDSMVITRGTENCLFVYPLDVWEEFENHLQKLPPTQKNVRFKRFLLDSYSDSVLDKQGRITLTTEQIQIAGLEKDVLIAGDIGKIQLWNPDRYLGEINSTVAGSDFDQHYYEAMASLNEMNHGPTQG